MKTMSEPSRAWAILSRVLLGRTLADRRITAGAEAAGELVADAQLVRGVRLEERLGVGVEGDEFDAHHLRPDHPVDGVAAAATDSDDPDQGEVLRVRAQAHRCSSERPHWTALWGLK